MNSHQTFIHAWLEMYAVALRDVHTHPLYLVYFIVLSFYSSFPPLLHVHVLKDMCLGVFHLGFILFGTLWVS